LGQDVSPSQADIQTTLQTSGSVVQPATNKVPFVRQIAVDAAAAAAAAQAAAPNVFSLGSRFVAADGTNKIFVRRDVSLDSTGELSSVSAIGIDDGFSSATLAQGQSCIAPPSGMVGWWPGDDNALDISGFGENGTVTSISYGRCRSGRLCVERNQQFRSSSGVKHPERPKYHH
jgi:hypothetical protein